MKVIVMSDSHGRDDRIRDLLSLHRDADYFIHCGDIECDCEEFPQLICVQGNNDLYYDYQQQAVLKLNGHNVLIIHSHQFPYYDRGKRMAQYAIKNHCEIVLYGHTHIASDEYVDGVRLINPGSLWRSRNGDGPSYLVLEFNQEDVVAELIKV